MKSYINNGITISAERQSAIFDALNNDIFDEIDPAPFQSLDAIITKYSTGDDDWKLYVYGDYYGGETETAWQDCFSPVSGHYQTNCGDYYIQVCYDVEGIVLLNDIADYMAEFAFDEKALKELGIYDDFVKELHELKGADEWLLDKLNN